MKDYLGNELKVGDEVIFIYNNLNGGGHRLMDGEIEKIEKGVAYIKGMKYSFHNNDPRKEILGNQVKVKSGSIVKATPLLKYFKKLNELDLTPSEELPKGVIHYLDYNY